MKEQEWLKVDSYTSIRISEYKGKYSLQKSRRGEQKNFVEWTNPLRYDPERKESVPATKDNGDPLIVPLQVPLGDEKKKAADMLRTLYFQLTGETIGTGSTRGQKGSQDSPPLESCLPPEPPFPPGEEEPDLPF